MNEGEYEPFKRYESFWETYIFEKRHTYHGKWNQRPEFKSCIKLFAFHFMLKPLGEGKNLSFLTSPKSK